jgi:hypothetical protein
MEAWDIVVDTSGAAIWVYPEALTTLTGWQGAVER